MIILKAGSTSKTVYVVAFSTVDGSRLTGLAYNTASLVAYYTLPAAAPVTIALATQTPTGAWSSGGFVEVDSTKTPGLYRLDLPDAAIASGNQSIVSLNGAANMSPITKEITLTAIDLQDAVHGGMSALPNTAITTNASLLTSGTGTDQLHVSSGHVANVDTLTTYTGNTPQTGDTYGRLGAPAGASIAADISTVFSTVMTEAYAAQGAAMTPAQALYQIVQQAGQMAISGTTMTVKKRNAATTAKTFTLDSATAPTSITETT